MARPVSREERRAWLRRRVEPLEVACRIRPGHAARVLDISAGGVLVEIRCRLAPGAIVEVHLESAGKRIFAQASVARCCVAQVRADLVLYHGGLSFDREIASL